MLIIRTLCTSTAFISWKDQLSSMYKIKIKRCRRAYMVQYVIEKLLYRLSFCDHSIIFVFITSTTGQSQEVMFPI